ncbi:PQQ-dependent sugar dehydrogenase [Flavobacteriaceae bacterium]|nr:PQQ-dependent sugar dehydrogenase [Flavobacteriaceae bacterium]MDC3238765.1 PQQ-dependent sugar dehydrogenase [Flavobacteriaceae bacterium]
MCGCKSPSPKSPLFLPQGFEATVFVDSIAETTRHLAVNKNGDLYAKFKRPSEAGVMAAIRDLNNDGVADSLVKFGEYHLPQRGSYSTAARIYKGYLYFSSQLTVYRIKLDKQKLVPTGAIEIIVHDDHPHGSHEHIGKPIAFDEEGHIFVPFGAPNNACQDPKRTPLVPGQDPCPLLEDHGGIWRFDAETIGQTQKDGTFYASGLRSIVALDWNTSDQSLYAVVHGRDDLHRLWPNHFSQWESAVLPSEEFIKVEKGDHFGWPYCFYDQMQGKKVLAPEYGGDGNIIGRCADYKDPVIGFPGHWAPNDLVFYTGDAFPDHYKNGAFIAFHGSTNRAPYPQSSYFIGFVPFENGKPSGSYEIFADGFAGVDPIVNTRDAEFRPMGIAFAPDGAMYIGETEKGRIWKVQFKGDRETFGTKELAQMEERKKLSHIRTPDIVNDRIEPKDLAIGQKIYNQYCMACHQSNGMGASGRFPPLNGTDWVTGDKQRLVNLILNGMEGAIEVNGEIYDGVMPQHSFLNDDQIADVLTYIRTHFGNQAESISAEEVEKLRKLNIK